jgi:hypothetical protein
MKRTVGREIFMEFNIARFGGGKKGAYIGIKGENLIYKK